MSVLVSAIIPVYNSEEFLEECIVSLINQTLKNIEIIVVNDGPTDGTLDIIKNIGKQDYRINIITQENKGVIETRKIGLSVARKVNIFYLLMEMIG